VDRAPVLAPGSREGDAQDRPAAAPAGERDAGAANVKSRFLNMVAHELNTPLTPLRLQAHMLATGALGTLPPKAVKAVGVIERNLERLHDLVQEILDVARMDGGGLRTTSQVFSLDEVLGDALESYGATAEELGLTVKAHGDPKVDVDADRKRTLQILHNLLSNAMKFTPRGGRVDVTVADHGDNVTVAVQDNGAGLDPDQLSALFQPFSRPLEHEVPDAGGTGLGLFISRGLAEAMGGALQAQSAGKGKGATFTLVLPKAGVHRPARPARRAETPIARRLREMM
jgi:signal transduction histidine kinase